MMPDDKILIKHGNNLYDTNTKQWELVYEDKLLLSADISLFGYPDHLWRLYVKHVQTVEDPYFNTESSRLMPEWRMLWSNNICRSCVLPADVAYLAAIGSKWLPGHIDYAYHNMATLMMEYHFGNFEAFQQAVELLREKWQQIELMLTLAGET